MRTEISTHNNYYDMVIETYREGEADLTKLVDTKTTGDQRGQVTFAKRSDYTGFTRGSNAGVDFTANTIKFELKRFTGTCAVSESDMKDDEGLERAVKEFMAHEAMITRSKAILDALKEQMTGTYTDYAAIQTAAEEMSVRNLPYASVVTNETGLRKITAATDGTGASVVKTNADGKPAVQICGYMLPIIALSDSMLPNDTMGAPVVVADLHDAVIIITKPYMTAKYTDAGQIGNKNLFNADLIGYEAAVELDAHLKDKDAVIGGYIA